MAPPSAPSVYAIRTALEQIEGAIRLEPLPEDTAAGTDLGTPIYRFGPDEFESRIAPSPSDFDDETMTASKHRTVVFEIPPRLTDADIANALGEGSGELLRLMQIKGTDALGWYVTFRQQAAQHGVYLPIEGIAELALGALGHLELPLERKLEIAFHAILRHELFHFEADCMTANLELSTGKEVYWWVAEAHRDLPGYKDLEEALANAHMLRGFRHPARSLRDTQGASRSVGLDSLGVQRSKPGGPGCYSIRIDGNYRAHLRRDPESGSWIAESIGDHRSMGHG